MEQNDMKCVCRPKSAKQTTNN